MGYDRRWLYPNLVRQDLGDALSIQDFTQTARTVVGTVERSPVAATDKATLNTTTTLANEAVKQEAIILDAIPLALLESVNGMTRLVPGRRRVPDPEGDRPARVRADRRRRPAVRQHRHRFGRAGEERGGCHASEGANPDMLVLNATDAAALDLTADAGGYIFPTRDTGVASPLWDLKVVERTSAAGTEAPYVLDSKMLGVLYLGPSRVDLDPFAGVGGANFKRNLIDLQSRADRAVPRQEREGRSQDRGDLMAKVKVRVSPNTTLTGPRRRPVPARATSSTSTTTTPWPSGSLPGGSSRFRRASRPARVRARPETPQRPAWLASAGGPLRSNERHHSHA